MVDTTKNSKDSSKKNKSFIVRSNLDEIIRGFEEALSGMGLDVFEQSIVLDVLQDRLKDRLTNIKMRDAVASAPLGGILSRITGSMTKQKDFDEDN